MANLLSSCLARSLFLSRRKSIAKGIFLCGLFPFPFWWLRSDLIKDSISKTTPRMCSQGDGSTQIPSFKNKVIAPELSSSYCVGLGCKLGSTQVSHSLPSDRSMVCGQALFLSIFTWGLDDCLYPSNQHITPPQLLCLLPAPLENPNWNTFIMRTCTCWVFLSLDSGMHLLKPVWELVLWWEVG